MADQTPIRETAVDPLTPRLTAHQVAEILCGESWDGRWRPHNQGLNVRPLANHTAEALCEALDRLGFAIVAVATEYGSTPEQS